MILFLSVAMLLAGCDKDNAPVAVSEVTLSRTALTMTVGDTEKLTATVLPEHAGYDGLVWSSNNTSVALVDVEGLVTAVSAGNATITATVGGKQATCEMTVADAVPEGFTVTTYEALLEALRTGVASADVPTLIMLGSDITIPAGGDHTSPPINGSGYFKIDGGGHTLTWEGEDNDNFHFLGNADPDADAVYIELTNINLDQQGMNSAVAVYNGRITLGKDVALNGQYDNMILAYGEKAALELGDGCELAYTTDRSYCVSVWSGATLVLNGGKTAAGAYIDLSCYFDPAASHSLISVPKALTGDVQLLLATTGVTSIAQGAGGYQLTQADCDHLKVNPESMVSLYGEPLQKYDDNFELYLDPAAEHQIELRLKNFTPPASGNIDMTSMTADEAQTTILAALATGFTELKLTGELSKIGMGGNWGTFINNKKITKCDLTGVTGWGRTPTLPDEKIGARLIEAFEKDEEYAETAIKDMPKGRGKAQKANFTFIYKMDNEKRTYTLNVNENGNVSMTVIISPMKDGKEVYSAVLDSEYWDSFNEQMAELGNNLRDSGIEVRQMSREEMEKMQKTIRQSLKGLDAYAIAE